MPVDAQGMAHSSNSVPGEKSVGHKTDNSTVPRQSRQSQWDMRLGQSHTQYRAILSKWSCQEILNKWVGGKRAYKDHHLRSAILQCRSPHPPKNHFNLSSNEEEQTKTKISFQSKVFLTWLIAIPQIKFEIKLSEALRESLPRPFLLHVTDTSIQFTKGPHCTGITQSKRTETGSTGMLIWI